MEYLCADTHDDRLAGFLARFSPNSIVFPWTPDEFVGELSRLVGPTAAAPGVAAAPAAAAAPRRAANARGPSIFISYASENAAEAKRLAEQLPALGFGRVWLDQTELISGDAWAASIHEAVQDCDFFMPVLSHDADQRRKGVFWEEWRLAIQQATRVHDAFLLPVGVDAQPPAKMNYERIFSGTTKELATVHLLHAQGGQLGDKARDDLRERCRRFAPAPDGGRG
jgi:hypothetical protein